MGFDLSARPSVYFLGAAMIAALGMLASYSLAKRVGAISQVRLDRWHTRPFVPRFAGPALVVAIAPWVSQAHLIILAGFCFVGCLDDVRPLTPRLKFLLLLVPTLVTWTLTGSLWQAVACFIMATSLNLLDHADGLAGSVSLVSLALAEGALGLSGAGACFGFLMHNYPPARAFLGDGGSHLLGAMLVLAWADHGIGATCLGCLIPLLDTCFVAVRRLVEGRRPWVGGTDHTGHVLLRAGLAPKLLPLVYASLAGIAVVAGRRWLL